VAAPHPFDAIYDRHRRGSGASSPAWASTKPGAGPDLDFRRAPPERVLRRRSSCWPTRSAATRTRWRPVIAAGPARHSLSHDLTRRSGDVQLFEIGRVFSTQNGVARGRPACGHCTRPVPGIPASGPAPTGTPRPMCTTSRAWSKSSSSAWVSAAWVYTRRPAAPRCYSSRPL
jgi:hypothetical protein